MFMKSKFLKCLGITFFTLFSAAVFAQATPPAPSLADATPVAEGTVGLVPVEVDWFSDGTVALIQFDISYDSANLTPDLTGCGGPVITPEVSVITVACSNPGPGVVRIAADDSNLNVIADRLLATVEFDVSAAAVGVYPLTVSAEVYGDSNSESVTPGTPANGSITITAAPAAAYTSDPVPGLFDVGSVVQNAGDISRDLSISNTGAVGTTLTGSCSVTADPGSVFSVSNESFSVLNGDPADLVTVTCDSAGAVTTHTGTLSCAHNGDDAGEPSPALYDLSCTITAAPEAAYGSTPAPGAIISMNATNVGDTIADEMVVIDNIGDDGTTLSGTCGISGDTEISLAGGGAFSVVKGGATAMLTVSCDSSAEGTFTSTLSCSHNGSNVATPAEYTVNCNVGSLRPAVFGSNPPDGTSVDISGGLDVVVGDAAPQVTAQISNDAVAPAQDLDISCSVTGDAAISVAPDLSGGALISAGGSANATFSCATDTAGTFTATFSCEYVTDSSGEAPIGGTATWPLSCDVREAKSEVTPDPAGGTTLTQEVTPGDSAQFSVIFTEEADEGVDGSVNCTVDNAVDFVIDTSMPAVVPAGGSVEVTVTGTAPADVESLETVLRCTYTDSDNEEGVEVTYPLVLDIGGGTANFVVTKTFSDDNVSDVEVGISCNDGFVNADTATITGDGVDSFRFIVRDFIDGALDCTISELSQTEGYEPSDPCVYEDLTAGDYTCAFNNSAEDATFTVNKVWVLTDDIGDEVDQTATITISCNNVINSVTGGTIPDYVQPLAVDLPAPNYAVRQLVGDGTIVVEVDATQNAAICSASESIMASGVEAEDDCGERTIAAGESSECTFTNTVFFEGIPTLSQYGLALMALLMLGIGMVGFRRFA